MMLNQTGVFSTIQVVLQQGDRQQAMASHKISRPMTTPTPPRRGIRLGHLGYASAVHGGDRRFSSAPHGASKAPLVNSSPPTHGGSRLHQGGMGWVGVLPDIRGFQHWRFVLRNQRVTSSACW